MNADDAADNPLTAHQSDLLGGEIDVIILQEHPHTDNENDSQGEHK